MAKFDVFVIVGFAEKMTVEAESLEDAERRVRNDVKIKMYNNPFDSSPKNVKAEAVGNMRIDEMVDGRIVRTREIRESL